MVLVLLLVPALVAVQTDFGRMFRSLGRGARRGPQVVLWVAGLSMLGLFAMTLGPLLALGGLPGWMVALVPALSGATPGMAFGLFVAGSGIVALVCFAFARFVPFGR
jgi:hypothetical protein